MDKTILFFGNFPSTLASLTLPLGILDPIVHLQFYNFNFTKFRLVMQPYIFVYGEIFIFKISFVEKVVH